MSNFLDSYWNRAKIVWLGFIISGILLLVFHSSGGHGAGLVFMLASALAAIYCKSSSDKDEYTHFSHSIKITLLFIVVFLIAEPGLTFLFYVDAFIALGFGVVGLVYAEQKKPLGFIPMK
jgi:hypothetical protein